MIPKSSCNEIVGWENDELKVRLTAVPHKGEANDALIRLLAKELKIRKSQITLTHGKTSRHKRLCVSGITPDTLDQLLSTEMSE